MEETAKKPTRLLSPKIDSVFQVLFGEVGSEFITKELLEAILGEEISDVDLSNNPVLRRFYPEDKMGMLDVLVRFNNNTTCNIEMQMVNTGEIIERMLFYWAKTFTRNVKKGQNYHNLERTIMIIILNEEIPKLKELGFITKHKITETETKMILTDLLEIVIIEIPKIYKNKAKKDKRKLLDWLYFLENPESKEVVKIMENNEGVKKAKEKLEEISNDPKMQRIADWKEKYILEMNTTKTDGYNEGLEQGQKLGLEQGQKLGLEQGQKIGEKLGEINKEKEIAKKLKQKNVALEEIAEITGLSIDEIKRL